MILRTLNGYLDKAWSDKRLRLVILGAGANLVSTVLSFMVFFISVPLTVSYLGPERFGVWMAIASLASMLGFMDFGVGNGLVSQVAARNVQTNKQQLQDTISSGLVTLSVIGALGGMLMCLLNTLFPLVQILNVESTQAKQDARDLVLVFILFFSINIPLNGIYKIMLGLQRNWLVHTIKSCASLLSLILIVTLAHQEADPAWLLLATFGVQVTAAALLIPYFFRQKFISATSLMNWRNHRAEYKALLNVGGLFLVLQLGVMCGWGADALLISSLASVSAVAQFAVVHRLYQFVSVPITIINTPMWGAYADAYAHEDYAFIARNLKRSMALSLGVSSIFSVTLYLASDLIFALWLKDELIISQHLILGFTVWKILESVGHSLSMALNGMHIIKPQVVSVMMLCAIVLPLKFIYTPHYGGNAVIWSTVLAYSLSTLLFYLIYFRRQIGSHLRPVKAA